MNLLSLVKSHKILVTGETDNGDMVLGYLTILSAPFEQIDAGFYISNKAGCPFAYKVRKSTVNVVVSKS